ncbi:unnamed protein product, partial [Ilex paraguariensis]
MAFTFIRINLVSLVILLCWFIAVDNTVAEWFNYGGNITNRGIADQPNRHICNTSGGKWGSVLPIMEWIFVCSQCLQWYSYMEAKRRRVNWVAGNRDCGERVRCLEPLRRWPETFFIVGIYGPAVVIAVSRWTGELVWSTRIDPRPLVLVTASGTIHLG